MLEEKVREAIVRELQRQAQDNPRILNVSADPSGRAANLTVDGRIDLDALAMAVVGTVAGGP